jgi:hypothetical protein
MSLRVLCVVKFEGREEFMVFDAFKTIKNRFMKYKQQTRLSLAIIGFLMLPALIILFIRRNRSSSLKAESPVSEIVKEVK